MNENTLGTEKADLTKQAQFKKNEFLTRLYLLKVRSNHLLLDNGRPPHIIFICPAKFPKSLIQMGLEFTTCHNNNIASWSLVFVVGQDQNKQKVFK